MEICEDKGYVTRLPCNCEKICRSLIHQLDSEQWDLAIPKICRTAEMEARQTEGLCKRLNGDKDSYG